MPFAHRHLHGEIAAGGSMDEIMAILTARSAKPEADGVETAGA